MNRSNRPLPALSVKNIVGFGKKVTFIGPRPKDRSLGRCWLWSGSLNSYGYGVISIRDKSTGRDELWLATRLAYMLETGEDPGERIVCHRCNNPACVNPRHLYAGTFKDNYDDAVRAGTHYSVSRMRTLEEANN